MQQVDLCLITKIKIFQILKVTKCHKVQWVQKQHVVNWQNIAENQPSVLFNWHKRALGLMVLYL